MNPESLTEKESDGIQAMCQQLIRISPPRKQLWDVDISSLVLMVATDCNIRCTYCYAKQGSYGKIRQTMKVDVAEAAVRKVLACFPHVRHIRLFGGEPLLNIKVIEKTCELVRDKLGYPDMKFSIEINGTLLDEHIIGVLKEYNVDVGVSLDGPSKLHDSHRVSPGGKGTHMIVHKNIERLIDNEIRVATGCTYTEDHKQMPIEELMTDLREISPFYEIAPCTSPDGTSVEIEDAERFYLYPLQQALEDHPAYPLHVLQLFSPLFAEAIPEQFCAAQSRLVIFPDGSVHPCEQLDDQQFFMGNIGDDNFPGDNFHATRQLLFEYRRSRIPSKYWYRYIVNPLCIAEFKDLQDVKDMCFLRETEKLYKKLLFFSAELMSDNDSYPKLIKVFQVLSGMHQR